ncbi:DUF3011 domain-containing protein [Lysobacter silvisoli]|uniref:DUF3011 domain-containing protein n=1 Tax=Lysobacter silvisoli TaxID=2293254 RepID=A0A371K756_9GAMM|nr:DUF3011 domain-containing protein [Lysobacter silvisoli]
MLKPLSLALCLAALATPALVQAQVQTRAYAPENLRTLSHNDQVRVISLEYSEQSGGRRIPDDQLRFYLDQVNRSNWTFSRIKSDIATSLGGGGVGPGPQPGGSIRCESTDGRPRTCRAPWNGYSRLLRQLSKTPCTEGQTWQSRDGNIYVSGGCRGEFGPGLSPPVPPVGQTVRCESNDGRPRTCQVPWNGRTRLSRQLSSSACVEGRSWQQQNGSVWVSQGCRAEFVADYQVQPPVGGRRVSCSSNDNRTTTCAWPPGYGVPRLIQQVSRQPCIQGQTWGISSATAIWVSRGCRGVFGN